MIFDWEEDAQYYQKNPPHISNSHLNADTILGLG